MERTIIMTPLEHVSLNVETTLLNSHNSAFHYSKAGNIMGTWCYSIYIQCNNIEFALYNNLVSVR